MIPSFREFIEATGFNSGKGLEYRDYQARSRLLTYIKKIILFPDIRCIAHDSSEANPCRIAIFRDTTGGSDNEVFLQWRAGQIKNLSYDELLSTQTKITAKDLDLLTIRAYDPAMRKPHHRDGKFIHYQCGKLFPTFAEAEQHASGCSSR